MSLVDAEGRLFGRVNLVDAAVVGFVLFLIPVGYATYLLFRPSRPVIDSVTRVEITREERRVGGGALVAAKLKVRGSGFNPLLRARIGGVEALGFVFENPNSADVIVGAMPAGRHDLVLYDGVQEVARAPESVEIVATEAPRVRAFGWLTNLSAEEAAALKPGYASPPHVPSAFEIVSIDEARPARARIAKGSVAVDFPVAGKLERAAELLVRCDWPASGDCSIGGQLLTEPHPITVTLPGGLQFQLDEIAPPSSPVRVTARVQFTGPLPAIAPGDRDALVGSRAAEVVSTNGAANPIVTLRLGADESREGWRYRGQLLAPGAPFALRTNRYVAGGTVLSAEADSEAARP
jgi:hypothetical protein